MAKTKLKSKNPTIPLKYHVCDSSVMDIYEDGFGDEMRKKLGLWIYKVEVEDEDDTIIFASRELTAEEFNRIAFDKADPKNYQVTNYAPEAHS